MTETTQLKPECGFSIASPTRGFDDPTYLIEFMMAVRKRFYQEKAHHNRVITERLDGKGMGRLQVYVGNILKKTEFYITETAGIDLNIVQEIASCVSQTKGTVRLVVPNRLKFIKTFRSRGFRRAAERRFDVMIYDSGGVMIKLFFS